MFTFYGNNNDTFCVCQECGTIWHIQGEFCGPARIVNAMPEDVEDIDTALLYDFFESGLPWCCDETTRKFFPETVVK